MGQVLCWGWVSSRHKTEIDPDLVEIRQVEEPVHKG